MRIKICGITQVEQGKAIASFGATALGFICVPTSPRFISATEIKMIIEEITSSIALIGVFANAYPDLIIDTAMEAGLTGIQLHGEESPQFCQGIKERLPDIELIKAFRVKNLQTLEQIPLYTPYIDTLLLDAYHPHQLGGTGKTIDSQLLTEFKSPLPWFLAGGLTPDNIIEAVQLFQPDGIDLSSGVERSPGDKDLVKVKQLFDQIGCLS